MRVLLLHGFAGSPQSWNSFVKELPDGATVLAPALMGHGAGGEARHSFDEEVEHIAGLLAATGGSEPWHVVGYSLGGRVALGLWERVHFGPASQSTAPCDEDPTGPRLCELTLVGANPGLISNKERSERCTADERWARLLEQAGVEAFLEEWRKLPLFRTQLSLPQSILEEQHRINRQHDSQGLASAMRVLSLGRMPSYWESMRAWKQLDSDLRIRWVAGSLDSKFTQLGVDAARLSETEFVAVDGVGHNVLLEAPQQLAQIVLGADSFD